MQNRGLAPNLRTYNALMDAYAKAGLPHQAWALLRHMLEAPGVAPDTITFSTLIAACVKSAQWADALSALEQMRALGVPPNAVTYNALLAACSAGALPPPLMASIQSPLS
jgi:pentatricopeptide repeat domain-containing protein 1